MRSKLLPAALILASLLTSGCATKHLMRWSRGEASLWANPAANADAYVRPAGAILAFPITLVWDVVTFPFQFFWDVYPYGATMSPEDVLAKPNVGEETPADRFTPVQPKPVDAPREGAGQGGND